MTRQRGIFLSAALFNWTVGGALLLAPQLVGQLLALEPVAAGAQVFVDLFAALVIAFGFAYLMLAVDFRQFRPYALLGAGAKLAVVAVVLTYFLTGLVGWQMLALSSVDLLYALIFLALLRASQGTSP